MQPADRNYWLQYVHIAESALMVNGYPHQYIREQIVQFGASGYEIRRRGARWATPDADQISTVIRQAGRVRDCDRSWFEPGKLAAARRHVSATRAVGYVLGGDVRRALPGQHLVSGRRLACYEIPRTWTMRGIPTSVEGSWANACMPSMIASIS
jgi:hypothetical protein